MSVIGILSPRCCSFFRGSWLILSGMNMPSSPSTETESKLRKSRTERHSAVAREYLEIIEFFLYGSSSKKTKDIIRGVPKAETTPSLAGELREPTPVEFATEVGVRKITTAFQLPEGKVADRLVDC